jgi:hypothetical protein
MDLLSRVNLSNKNKIKTILLLFQFFDHCRNKLAITLCSEIGEEKCNHYRKQGFKNR